MSTWDYNKNNKCSICGIKISNRAKNCIKHTGFSRNNFSGISRNRSWNYNLGKKCPVCGIKITNKSTRCSACNGLERRRPLNKKCVDCGKLISRRAIRCRSCSKTGIPREDIRGENNPKWNGGWIDYYGPNWEFQRKLTLKRDNYLCILCGKKEKDLNVHHQIPFSKCSDYLEANELENLVSVCYRCHLILEKQNLEEHLLP